MRRIAFVSWPVIALAACHGGAQHGTLVTLRAACKPSDYWDGTACKPRGDGAEKVAAGKAALAKQDVDQAKAALDAADHGGPLDHDANVTLWEQRGIAAAYADDATTASSAFDMMLALDPQHLLSYTLSPKATFVFQKVRENTSRVVPAVDINLPHGQKVGDPLPLELEVVADPKKFLHRATVFVRTRGERDWRAADLPLTTAKDHRLVLPPIEARQPVSLELYLRAYDDRGNEVLTWADPTRPREIPLRYDPPPPWYASKEFLIPAGLAVGIGIAITAYALAQSPPDKIGGPVSVAK